MMISSKNTLTEVSRIMFDQISALWLSQVDRKLTITSCNPAVALLGIYLIEVKTYFHTQSRVIIYSSFIYSSLKLEKLKCPP